MTALLIFIAVYLLFFSKKSLLTRLIEAVVGAFFLFVLFIAYVIYSASI